MMYTVVHESRFNNGCEICRGDLDPIKSAYEVWRRWQDAVALFPLFSLKDKKIDLWGMERS